MVDSPKEAEELASKFDGGVPAWVTSPGQVELILCIPHCFTDGVFSRDISVIVVPSPFCKPPFGTSVRFRQSLCKDLAPRFRENALMGVVDVEGWRSRSTFDLSMCGDLADALRHVLKDSAQHSESLAVWIARLQNAADAAVKRSSDERRRSMVDMIHLLSLADLLRCSSNLYSVIMCACEFVLPNSIFMEVKRAVDTSRLKLPDKGQISRARLYIDVAIMLWQRVLNSPGSGTEDSGGFVRYLSWDSSPQFERDYELCLVQSCRRADLRKVFKASRDLMSMWDLKRATAGDWAETAKKEASCMECIREHVSTHALPSVLVGCRVAKFVSFSLILLDARLFCETIRFGSSTFGHKLRSLAHALRLEHFSHESLSAFSRDLVSVVSDYGTERLLCKMAPIDVGLLCPWFSDTADADIEAVRRKVHQFGLPDPCAFEDPDVEAALIADDDDDSVVFEAPEPENVVADAAADHSDGDSNVFEDVPPPPTFDPSGALDAPGLHHFVDNLTKSLSSVMRHYDACIDLAVIVCRLLHRRSPREKLLERCFRTSVGQAFRKDIQKIRGHIHKGRWGTVMFSVPELLKVEKVLRWAWDKDAFMGRAGADGANDDEDTNLAVEADKAISSPFWWGWLHMLEHVCKVVRRAISWIEGCSCHSKLLHGEVSDFPPELVRQWRSCPMRGRRAAEISAGDFAEVLAAVTGTSIHLVCFLFLFPFVPLSLPFVSSFFLLFSFCLPCFSSFSRHYFRPIARRTSRRSVQGSHDRPHGGVQCSDRAYGILHRAEIDAYVGAPFLAVSTRPSR